MASIVQIVTGIVLIYCHGYQALKMEVLETEVEAGKFFVATCKLSEIPKDTTEFFTAYLEKDQEVVSAVPNRGLLDGRTDVLLLTFNITAPMKDTVSLQCFLEQEGIVSSVEILQVNPAIIFNIQANITRNGTLFVQCDTKRVDLFDEYYNSVEFNISGSIFLNSTRSIRNNGMELIEILKHQLPADCNNITVQCRIKDLMFASAKISIPRDCSSIQAVTDTGDNSGGIIGGVVALVVIIVLAVVKLLGLYKMKKLPCTGLADQAPAKIEETPLNETGNSEGLQDGAQQHQENKRSFNS